MKNHCILYIWKHETETKINFDLMETIKYTNPIEDL